MTKTIQSNYQRNIEVLKENLRRGMTSETATGAIDNMEKQFNKAGLLGQAEKDFINDMRAEVVSYFLKIEVIINK